LQYRLDGEVHLWFAFPGETKCLPKDFGEGLSVFQQPARMVLDDGEKARMGRLRYPAGRRLFETSHALLRRALSCYGDIPPEQWRFVINAHGKPRIDPDLGAPPLMFSLSHTRGAAIVAITQGADVGADVERGDRMVDAARLSRRFFSPEEDAALLKMTPDALQEHFFHFWTLKESYIKARGLGLRLPLDSFSFRLEGSPPCRIGFSGDDPADAGKWLFALFKPLPSHVAAVGISPDRPSGPISLRCFHALPSGRVSPLGVAPLGLSPGMEIHPR
jgi:4'-phosphopantetheinyl transferase